MLVVHCTGRLIKDPTVFEPTEGKKAYTTFTLVTSEYAGTNPDNTPKYKSTFLNCSAFDRIAVAIGKCVKGDVLEIYGRSLEARPYETKEGKAGASLDCVVREWERVSSASATSATSAEKKEDAKTEAPAKAASSDEDEDLFS